MQFDQDYYNQLSGKIINSCIEVHKQVGPGLLESVYQVCLEKEFELNQIQYKTQVPIPVIYKGIPTGKDFYMDFLVEDKIILELKSVENLIPIFDAQLITYLRLANKKLGLIINFNVPVLKSGIKRLVNNF
ncbi:MAG: GxxExxY protein [Bacteroidetes bacterium]|nr:GxxExxY protein [Bacteroidota bacterium]